MNNILFVLIKCFARMGDSRRKVDETDLLLAETWQEQWHMPEEVIFYAAECSHGAKSPYRMIKRLLEAWHIQKIDSVSAARAAFKASSPSQALGQPANRALQYDQRSTEERGDLNSLIQY